MLVLNKNKIKWSKLEIIKVPSYDFKIFILFKNEWLLTTVVFMLLTVKEASINHKYSDRSSDL